MSIKRGVSLYSYQQAQFFGKMTIRDMIKEMHDNLHCRGVEMIDESTVPHYPFPDENFYAEWNDLMAEYDMEPVTSDIFLDVLQFRDHVMTYREAADRLGRDLRIAARMGFHNVRCVSPIEVIELALPVAEEVGVCIAREVHAPSRISPEPVDRYFWDRGIPRNPRGGDELIELALKKNTKYVGMVPDLGIFQTHLNRPHKEWLKRHGYDPEAIEIVDYIMHVGIRNPKWAEEMLRQAKPDVSDYDAALCAQVASFSTQKPEDLIPAIPYIVSVHGKCYDLQEVPGCPGQYEEPAVDYEGAFAALKKGGYDGYVNTEFEGQREQQDMGLAGLCDEVEQVRRHHKMMAELLGE